MAVVSGGTAVPIKFNTLQANGLYDYDLSTVSSTSAKYYDNATNYTLFQGSGFTFNAAHVPTGGTVTSVRYVINGNTALLMTGLSIAAKTVHNYASQNNTQGLLGHVLSGADTLNGTPLADVLYGYAGNDILKGAGGKDVLDGGTGADTALYTDKTGAVVVTLKGATNTMVAVGGVAEDIIRNIENLTGGAAADTLTGDGNVLNGGGGKDTFFFNGALGATNIDTISDFVVVNDTIRLENAVFAALLRRTKAAMIYKATGNLRAIQILLGHTKIENTVKYLGVDIEDALELAEHTEI